MVFGSVTITNSTISNNSVDATYYGAAITVSEFSDGHLTMTNSTLSGNTGPNALRVEGVADLKGNLVANSSGDNCDVRAGGTLNDLGGNLADDATCDTIPDTRIEDRINIHASGIAIARNAVERSMVGMQITQDIHERPHAEHVWGKKCLGAYKSRRHLYSIQQTMPLCRSRRV